MGLAYQNSGLFMMAYDVLSSGRGFPEALDFRLACTKLSGFSLEKWLFSFILEPLGC